MAGLAPPVIAPAAAKAQDVAPPQVTDVLRESGSPLPEDVRREMEPRFGFDFSKVRVHAGARAADAAESVQAKAFTVGPHVVFRERMPEVGSGYSLWAHELAHVVQQRGAAFTDRPRVGAVNSALEGEAKRAAHGADVPVRLGVPFAELQMDRGEPEIDIPGFVEPVETAEDYQVYRLTGFHIYRPTDSEGSPNHDPGKAWRIDQFKEDLNRLIIHPLRLRDDNDVQITIIGTVSNSRIEKNVDANWLALMRADEVAKYLQDCGIPSSRIHAISEGTRGAPGRKSGAIAKATARSVFIHVRHQQRQAPDTFLPPENEIDDTPATKLLTDTAAKHAKSLVKKLLKGKSPKLTDLNPLDAFIEVFGNFADHVNADKFGHEAQHAFVDAWADTMARLMMDDPRHSYRLWLQSLLHQRASIDVRQLLAERATLPRQGLDGAWQIGQFRLAGVRKAYDWVRAIDPAAFEQLALEYRDVYQTLDALKKGLKSMALHRPRMMR